MCVGVCARLVFFCGVFLLFCFFNLECCASLNLLTLLRLFLYCSFIKCSALFKDAPMLICTGLKEFQNSFLLFVGN